MCSDVAYVFKKMPMNIKKNAPAIKLPGHFIRNIYFKFKAQNFPHNHKSGPRSGY